MAVSMDLTQSGSAATVIHAAPADTVTFLLGATVKNDVLAAALAPTDAFIRVTGVIFEIDATGDGEYALTITQAGSASHVIQAAAGDTVTINLASVVENTVLAAMNAYFQALTPITGVIFAISTAGNAS